MSRSTGRTAVGIVAYATGERMKDNETGKWCKRNHPGDVLEWGTVIPPNAPAWLADRDKLSDAWNASTACEKRKDSELAKHWNIALPRQSTPEQQGELMRGMAQKITDRYGVMVTWAVHEAPEHGDDRNAHGHLVVGTRTIDENGFGPKAAGLNGPKRKAELVWQREMFADTINRYLEGQGIDERVSAKSYKDRGIDQEPTLHMGNAVNQAELKGECTSIGDENRARKARNAERDNIDRAMTYLEELGTRGMTDEELRRIQGLIDDLTARQTKMLQAYGREEADKDKTLKELTASGIKPKDAADMVESIIPLNPEAQKHISGFVADWKKEREIEERQWLKYRYDRIVSADLSNAKALQAAEVLGEMNGDGSTHQIVQKKDKFILLYTPEEWISLHSVGPSARREFHVTNSLDEMHDYIINRYDRKEIETKTAEMDREYAIREKAAFEASETLRRESLDARAAAPAPREPVAKPREQSVEQVYAPSEQLQAKIAANTNVVPQAELDARAYAKSFKPAPEPIISVEAKQAAKTVTRTADRGLMVAASATNKAMRLADFFSDFIAGPAPSKPKFTLDPVEISRQQAQRIAHRRAEEQDWKALRQIQDDIDKGRAIGPAELHNLTEQHKLAIKQFGDKALQDMLEADRKRREKDYGSER